jgi:excisionase family DNA binding protein
MTVQLVVTIPDSSVEALARSIAWQVTHDLGGSREAETPWLDVDGAAAYLATTPAAIRGLVKRRQIPHHRPIGTKRLLFHRDELDAWGRGEADDTW